MVEPQGPIGIVTAGNLDRTLQDTVEACLPTHGSTLAISGAAAVAFAIARAMDLDATLIDIMEAAAEGASRGRDHGSWAWTPPIDKRIALAVQIVRQAENEANALQSLYEIVGVDLTVPESIPTSVGLVALAESDPMQDIRYASNIGGDTDTIGAIAGAICGALQGIQSVDPAMLAKVEAANDIHVEIVGGQLVAVGEARRQQGAAWPGN